MSGRSEMGTLDEYVFYSLYCQWQNVGLQESVPQDILGGSRQIFNGDYYQMWVSDMGFNDPATLPQICQTEYVL